MRSIDAGALHRGLRNFETPSCQNGAVALLAGNVSEMCGIVLAVPAPPTTEMPLKAMPAKRGRRVAIARLLERVPEAVLLC